MRRYLAAFAVVLCVAMTHGCGHIDPNSVPTGVTGGTEDGYGTETTSGGDPIFSCANSALLGTWRYANYNGSVTWTFQSSCRFSMQACDAGSNCDTVTGTYEDSGAGLQMTSEGSTETATYYRNGNSLTMSMGGSTVTYTRI